MSEDKQAATVAELRERRIADKEMRESALWGIAIVGALLALVCLCGIFAYGGQQARETDLASQVACANAGGSWRFVEGNVECQNDGWQP